MKSILSFITLFLLTVFPGNPVVQEKYPKNYFRSPIDFPLQLSGSFGEVRKNHIHSGIDIRTQGVTGKPVYAAGDGYICRIFISSGGFGKALYIAHPNGYTTLYGHLEKFNSRIWAWIRAKQYKDESFEQDVTVEPGVLPVKKGEIIAYSGNTGMSGGPHLHFEFRDTPTQEIIDPLLFGLPLKDDIPPRIYSVRIYPKGENAKINNADQPLTLGVQGSDGRFRINTKEPVRVSGDVIFGLEAFDFVNDSELKNGVTSVSLFVDTTCVFFQKLDRFAFAETRYVNSLLDYPALLEHDQRYMRSYVAPNNKLRIYNVRKNNGIVSFTDSKTHSIRYVVGDEHGNKSQLEFSVTSVPPVPGRKTNAAKPGGKLIQCKVPGHFAVNDLVFDLPADALYEDLDFSYSTTPSLKNTFSEVHHLQDEYTPIHSYCDLSIRTNHLPAKLTPKAIIVRVSENNHFSSAGGKEENGFVKTRIREFGNYAVMVDTTQPVIHPVNIPASRNAGKLHSILFKLSDNLSGIKSYRGLLNGKWILMDFDAKSGSLEYDVDEHMKPGKNEFRLVVKDAVGNESVYKAFLNR